MKSLHNSPRKSLVNLLTVSAAALLFLISLASAAKDDASPAEDKGRLADLEWRGIMSLSNDHRFSLHDKSTGATFWIESGETVRGLEIAAFDRETMTLTVRHRDATRPLQLSAAVIQSPDTIAPLWRRAIQQSPKLAAIDAAIEAAEARKADLQTRQDQQKRKVEKLEAAFKDSEQKLKEIADRPRNEWNEAERAILATNDAHSRKLESNRGVLTYLESNLEKAKEDRRKLFERGILLLEKKSAGLSPVERQTLITMSQSGAVPKSTPDPSN